VCAANHLASMFSGGERLRMCGLRPFFADSIKNGKQA